MQGNSVFVKVGFLKKSAEVINYFSTWAVLLIPFHEGSNEKHSNDRGNTQSLF